MNLEEYRNQLDAIDDQIAALYRSRMEIAKKIGEEKAKNGFSVNVPGREKAIVNRVTASMEDDIKIYGKQLFTTLFNTSKAYQSALAVRSSRIARAIDVALADQRAFPISATVACQGVEGAYSGVAAERLFPISSVTYFKTFEGVFHAVEKGLCTFGVLPIENSTAGSVLAVYDLMKQHRFSVVRSVKLPVRHCLAGKKGADISEIRTVYSHEQAISQCKNYICETGCEPELCPNTAVAAKKVAESADRSVAAICSPECAELYGLTVLKSGIQDSANNHTRFICIAKDLQIYEGADKISVEVNLSHTPGSLNRVLNRFAALGLNLTKLESRPLADSDFEFDFYFDFDGDVRKPEVVNLLADLDDDSNQFVFLGCYKEIL